MATANTNKTILALGVVAVLGFLAYKLWPAIRKAINSGSGGGSGGAGPASAGSSTSPYNPYQNQGSGSSLGASMGSNPSTSPSNVGAAGRSALQQSLQNLISGSSYANNTPAEQDLLNTLVDQSPSDYPTSIPLEEYQLFDVNQMAYSPSDDGTDTADYSNASDYSSMDYADTVDPYAGLSIDDGSGDGSGGGDSIGVGGGGGY
jgi:hypothetical protein